MVCQLEHVVRFEEPRFGMAGPEDYFDLDSLNVLFQERALLIPFVDVGETFG